MDASAGRWITHGISYDARDGVLFECAGGGRTNTPSPDPTCVAADEWTRDGAYGEWAGGGGGVSMVITDSGELLYGRDGYRTGGGSHVESARGMIEQVSMLGLLEIP
jgi:hypothetical protein